MVWYIVGAIVYLLIGFALVSLIMGGDKSGRTPWTWQAVWKEFNNGKGSWIFWGGLIVAWLPNLVFIFVRGSIQRFREK